MPRGQGYGERHAHRRRADNLKLEDRRQARLGLDGGLLAQPTAGIKKTATSTSTTARVGWNRSSTSRAPLTAARSRTRPRSCACLGSTLSLKIRSIATFVSGLVEDEVQLAKMVPTAEQTQKSSACARCGSTTALPVTWSLRVRSASPMTLGTTSRCPGIRRSVTARCRSQHTGGLTGRHRLW